MDKLNHVRWVPRDGLGGSSHPGKHCARRVPGEAVTLVVPFAAGGSSDKIARDLAEALRKRLGISVVDDSRVEPFRRGRHAPAKAGRFMRSLLVTANGFTLPPSQIAPRQ